MTTLYDRLHGGEPQKRGITANFSTSGVPIGSGWSMGDITLSPNEQINAVMERCISLIADSMASLDLRVRKLKDDSEVENHALAQLWNRKPNDYLSARATRTIIFRRLQRHGQTFVAVDRGPTGEGDPKAIMPIFDDVRIVVDNRTDPLNPTIEGYQVGRTRIGLLATEMIWLRYVNGETHFDALSPTAVASYPAKLDAYAREWQLGELRGGARPSGILYLGDLEEGEANNVKASMRSSAVGPSNAGRVITMNGPAAQKARFERISMSPSEMNYIESRQMNWKEIAFAQGVPPDLIFGGSTYDNQRAAKVALWSETNLPKLDVVASELDFQLLEDPGLTCAFDTSKVEALRENENDLVTRTVQATYADIPLLDEARKKLGLDPLPGGKGQVTISEYRAQFRAMVPNSPGPGATFTPSEGNATPEELTPGYVPPEIDQRAKRDTVRVPKSLIEGHRSRAADQMHALLREQGEAIHHKVATSTGKASTIVKNTSGAKFKRRIMTLAKSTMTETAKDAGQHILDAASRKRAKQEYKPGDDLNKFITSQASMTGDSMVDTTTDELTDMCSKMEDNDETTEAILAAILAYFAAKGRAENRSDLFGIAATYPFANRASREAAAMSNAVEARQWLTAQDDRVDADCSPLEGQTARLDGAYPGGAEPGDVHVACRCTELFILKMDQSEEDAVTPEPIPVLPVVKRVIDRQHEVLRNRAKRKKLNGRFMDHVYWTYQFAEALMPWLPTEADSIAAEIVASAPADATNLDARMDRMRENARDIIERAIAGQAEIVPNA